MKTCAKCGGRFEDSMGFCPRDGEVLTKDQAGLVGRTLDNQYEIEKFIAAGGMGAVYRARHILLGDTVAIKILSPEMSNNTEWLKRFQREGQVARKFRHPNAVLVHDLRTSSDGLIYMVMEYVEGRTLDALLRERGRLTPREALTLLEPIASVLDAAHSMGVVHRDLKPENVMLGQSAVKLLDLGIAKMREIAEGGGATSLTVAGQILGTPYYMSPEQWGEIPRDGATDIDARADIYSFGVIFYELITGRKPFGGQTLAELRRSHVSFTPQPLRDFAPDVPEEFNRVIERALAKDRGDRPSTAGQLISEIRAALGLDTAYAATNPRHPAVETDVLPRTNDPSAASRTSADAGHSLTPPASNRNSANTENIAPTIIEDGSTLSNQPAPGHEPRAPETVSQPASASTSANAGVARFQPPLPTMATSANAVVAHAGVASSPGADAARPVGGVSPPLPPTTPAPPKSRSVLLPVLGVVALLLLVGIGAGGWFGWKYFMSDDGRGDDRRGTTTTATTNTSTTNPVATSAPSVNRPEPIAVADWWLEVAPLNGPDTNVRRAAGEQMAVSSQEKFRFAFRPRESGYFYVVGPGEGGALTTFLTARPSPQSGVKSNRAERNQEYKLNWMALDKSSPSEKYIAVFSPVELSAPAFLATAALRQLSPAEREEWASFLAREKANQGEAAVTTDGGGTPAVVVNSLRTPGDKSPPAVFEININRK